MQATDQLLGQSIGSYRITSFIGAGGMAEVYAGEHVDPEMARRVAIKALRPEFCQQPAFVERFMNEARALGRIRHPAVVDIYEVDRLPDGRICLVMEYLRGETLSAYLSHRGRLNIDEAVAIALNIASAMHAAHVERIIHRDLKPDNVFIQKEAAGLYVRVLDFGVAKLLDGAGAVHTGTRTTMGTAAYMSPEQFRSSRDVDVRSDVYALGCVLFEMLTGRQPYAYRNLAEQMHAHAFEAIPSAAQLAGVPPIFDAVLTRMLAKQRDDRFGSMQEVIAALTAAGTDHGGAAAFDDDAATVIASERNAHPTVADLDEIMALLNPGPPPSASRAWIVAVIVAVVILLGGAGTAAVLALR